ncbi:MAG: RHS repeat-associated core domain-containing protein [Anaerosomatales bacterium]|nr:RHS repeat-associated core domain-containing protein [Anaerosomatales bacterium]
MVDIETAGSAWFPSTEPSRSPTTTNLTATFASDASGARTQMTLHNGALTSYGYDAAGRPISWTAPTGEVTTYAYDAAGNLVGVSKDGSATAEFAVDAADRITSPGFTYDAAGNLTSDGERRFAYDAAGNLFSMTWAGETYYYHLNARGDVVALTDSRGAVVNAYAYDPWGNPLTAEETVANPYRYASYRYDASTGLYYCWNRYYAPALARFLTRDIYPGELADPATMNPYLYCGGDPVNAVDPSGLLTFGSGVYGDAQAFGAGYSKSFQVVGDDCGNLGLMESVAYQGSPIPAASGGVQLQVSGAPTIFDLEGAAGGGGASCSFGGVDGFAANTRWGDVYGGGSLQIGLSVYLTGLGAEVHGTVSSSRLLWSMNMQWLYALPRSTTPVPVPQNPLASREW